MHFIMIKINDINIYMQWGQSVSKFANLIIYILLVPTYQYDYMYEMLINFSRPGKYYII